MAARNSSAPAAHPLHQDSVAAPNSPLLAADPLHQAAVANPNSPVLAANPVHQASAAASSGMYGAPGALPTEQGSLTVLPPPQGAPVMKTVQGANTVVPMPLWELVMTVPLQGRPVMAPLPFPAQPPHAGYMMGQPLLRASPPPMAALHLPQAVHMVAQPPLPAGPPPLRRRRPDYFDMPFGPRMTGFELEMAGFDESMGLPYGPYINNECFSSLTLASLDIFRPFTGFCAVRLVNTGYNNRHVIAYADFETLAQAFSAMKSLQGYLFDMHDRYPVKLDLQFLPGPSKASRNRPLVSVYFSCQLSP
ncbi:hypothetical protein VPH35_091489 [Triticum aestivum]